VQPDRALSPRSIAALTSRPSALVAVTATLPRAHACAMQATL